MLSARSDGLLSMGGAVLALLILSPQPSAHARGELNSPSTLRAAVLHLTSKHQTGKVFSDPLLKRLESAEKLSPKDFLALQKEILLTHPRLAGKKLLYVERPQYHYNHHNTETVYQTGEINTRLYQAGGALKRLDLGSGEVTELFTPPAGGHLRDPDISSDGKRVIFSMRNSIEEDHHLHEILVDGSGHRQLTSAKGVFDIDPCYLPDGSIVFTSSRDPKYCGCNRHIMGNLYRMESDGANIHQLGKSGLFEGHSSMLPDGRVLYDRWEYVDRNFGDAQGLWTMNPDGTNHAVFWGNNTPSPGGVIDARAVPGSNLVMCVFSSCHDLPWGALALVDRSRGVDGREPVVRTWPADAIDLVGKGGWDTFKQVNPKYEDPWPIDEVSFLVSRQITPGERQTGIYLVDVFGNEVLLHEDGRGCYDPMIVEASEKPHAKPVARKYDGTPGRFYVQDVYVGTHMKTVERGEAKFLRVIEVPEKRNWTRSQWGGQGAQAPAMNWHSFENKRILGTVPIEDDGSVYFECPPDRFVYFQLLDAEGMMIQSMRSGTMIQPGETQGCVGCHEDRNESSIPAAGMPTALRQSPLKLEELMGGIRNFGFQQEVQPIFDRHCVGCHDFGKPAGEKLNLARDRTLVFNASYTDLWSRAYLSCVGGGPAQIQQAKSWGARNSRLIKYLTSDSAKVPEHADLKVSQDDLDTLITWIDLNGPYYPTQESAYPDNLAGRSPLDDSEIRRLGKLTGSKFVTAHDSKLRAQISFERPELSPCLVSLEPNSDSYKEALEIISTGMKRLIDTPRCDMQGFEPCDTDRQRLEKQKRFQEIEQRNRKAIREGRKLYDRSNGMR